MPHSRHKKRRAPRCTTWIQTVLQSLTIPWWRSGETEQRTYSHSSLRGTSRQSVPGHPVNSRARDLPPPEQAAPAPAESEHTGTIRTTKNWASISSTLLRYHVG